MKERERESTGHYGRRKVLQEECRYIGAFDSTNYSVWNASLTPFSPFLPSLHSFLRTLSSSLSHTFYSLLSLFLSRDHHLKFPRRLQPVARSLTTSRGSFRHHFCFMHSKLSFSPTPSLHFLSVVSVVMFQFSKKRKSDKMTFKYRSMGIFNDCRHCLHHVKRGRKIELYEKIHVIHQMFPVVANHNFQTAK